MKLRLRSPLLQLTFAVLVTASPAAAQDDLPDLTHFNMEDLLSLQVTSVSKKPQKISDSAAAVFVITQQDIRRSGASSVPEEPATARRNDFRCFAGEHDFRPDHCGFATPGKQGP